MSLDYIYTQDPVKMALPDDTVKTEIKEDILMFKGADLENKLSASLLLFYIALSTNFLIKLFPEDHIRFFEDNTYIRHILGYMVMLFSLYHLGSIKSIEVVLFITSILYFWFLFTTKLPPQFNIVIVILLAIDFLINIKIKNLEKARKNGDPQHLYRTKYIPTLHLISYTIYFIIVVSTFITYFYLNFIVKK